MHQEVSSVQGLCGLGLPRLLDVTVFLRFRVQGFGGLRSEGVRISGL